MNLTMQSVHHRLQLRVATTNNALAQERAQRAIEFVAKLIDIGTWTLTRYIAANHQSGRTLSLHGCKRRTSDAKDKMKIIKIIQEISRRSRRTSKRKLERYNRKRISFTIINRQTKAAMLQSAICWRILSRLKFNWEYLGVDEVTIGLILLHEVHCFKAALVRQCGSQLYKKNPIHNSHVAWQALESN